MSNDMLLARLKAPLSPDDPLAVVQLIAAAKEAADEIMALRALLRDAEMAHALAKQNKESER